MRRIIFHIDVNNAFLSWSAVYRLSKGETLDIRTIPSVIGGDEASRRGVVLAKSNAAKKFGVVTGESIYTAKKKCPDLMVFPKNSDAYSYYSNEVIKIFQEYTDYIERYSIDESFLDVTALAGKEPYRLAYEIKERIKKELGFTVNVGISDNKILAKMASEFEKPDKIHTLYRSEIKEKLWPLPIEELFMVGKQATKRLKDMYIFTIGDLANYDPSLLKQKFKSYGELIWKYANGLGEEEINYQEEEAKVISNELTLPKDVQSKTEAAEVLKELADKLGRRIRALNRYCTTIGVHIKTSEFINYSHQKKLKTATCSTAVIYNTALELFEKKWQYEPVRLLGISLSGLCEEAIEQTSFFSDSGVGMIKEQKLDKVLDSLKDKYGDEIISKLSLREDKSGKRS
ncbi:DNA polymerase Y family protein [Alloiococcus sp. CFN-8]|uniref:DNA polymerase Y family protein n=1 Tax=Alloiococcus sp. CFN-8 TaxID=3416081 RepID=UPI003CE96CA6